MNDVVYVHPTARFDSLYRPVVILQPRHGREGSAQRGIFECMSLKLDIGRTYSSQTRVEEWMTAQQAGNQGVDVLSTPMLLQLIEEAAMHCVAPTLSAAEVTLATHIDLEHHKPTPVGFIVRTEVEVISIDGPRIAFAVQVFDEQENVAEGTHERFIIQRSKFLEKLDDKLA